MENGGWRLEVGWLRAKYVVPPLTTHHSPFAIRHLPLATHHSLLTTRLT
ncbi:MAG: hypothetical protein ABIG63_17260 [Chloroflexota bacterium]